LDDNRKPKQKGTFHRLFLFLSVILPDWLGFSGQFDAMA
jgi:hypothetical protein